LYVVQTPCRLPADKLPHSGWKGSKWLDFCMQKLLDFPLLAEKRTN
jgi:hypothetical protein